MEKEIREILENVMYWDTCPEDYKVKIKKFLNKEENAQDKVCVHPYAHLYEKCNGEYVKCMLCGKVLTQTKGECE